jgi:Arc/MetJ-type ribon-helix-helix transcriptional regulator
MDISLSLPPKLIRLIKAKVASGRYWSTSAAVRDALLFVEKIEQRRAEAVNRTRLLNRFCLEEEDLARREALKERLSQDLIRKYGKYEPPKTKAKARKKKV